MSSFHVISKQDSFLGGDSKAAWRVRPAASRDHHTHTCVRARAQMCVWRTVKGRGRWNTRPWYQDGVQSDQSRKKQQFVASSDLVFNISHGSSNAFWRTILLFFFLKKKWSSLYKWKRVIFHPRSAVLSFVGLIQSDHPLLPAACLSQTALSSHKLN